MFEEQIDEPVWLVCTAMVQEAETIREILADFCSLWSDSNTLFAWAKTFGWAGFGWADQPSRSTV